MLYLLFSINIRFRRNRYKYFINDNYYLLIINNKLKLYVTLGIIITKKSKFPSQAFELIKILIDEKYPYLIDLNISFTVM